MTRLLFHFGLVVPKQTICALTPHLFIHQEAPTGITLEIWKARVTLYNLFCLPERKGKGIAFELCMLDVGE